MQRDIPETLVHKTAKSIPKYRNRYLKEIHLFPNGAKWGGCISWRIQMVSYVLLLLCHFMHYSLPRTLCLSLMLLNLVSPPLNHIVTELSRVPAMLDNRRPPKRNPVLQWGRIPHCRSYMLLSHLLWTTEPFLFSFKLIYSVRSAKLERVEGCVRAADIVILASNLKGRMYIINSEQTGTKQMFYLLNWSWKGQRM